MIDVVKLRRAVELAERGRNAALSCRSCKAPHHLRSFAADAARDIQASIVLLREVGFEAFDEWEAAE